MATQQAPTPLQPHEALSGIFGSISLAAWVFVLIPQLVENYRQRSAAGISLSFLSVWFLGDVANLAGALWGGLLPTVVALAVYFCVADTVLILQCLYYNYVNRRGASDGDADAKVVEEEEEPLLGRRESGASQASIGLPGSRSRRRRRSSVASWKSGRRAAESSLGRISEEVPGGKVGREWVKNFGSVVLICALGAVGWVVAWRAGVWRPAGDGRGDYEGGDVAAGEGRRMPVGAEVLGYASAVCYLGARIPQIVKNWREKSCDGLSLLFFLLSLLGNLTYGAGILCHSLERQYVLVNLPWLIGSLGTMVEDIMIFVQFHIYGGNNPSELEEAVT